MTDVCTHCGNPIGDAKAVYFEAGPMHYYKCTLESTDKLAKKFPNSKFIKRVEGIGVKSMPQYMQEGRR